MHCSGIGVSPQANTFLSGLTSLLSALVRRNEFSSIQKVQFSSVLSLFTRLNVILRRENRSIDVRPAAYTSPSFSAIRKQ